MKKLLILITCFILLVGCSSAKEDSKTIQDYDEIIKENIDMTIFTEGTIHELEHNTKLTADDYEEFIMYTPINQLQISEVLLIKAENEEKAKEVEEALKEHIEKQIALYDSYLVEQADIGREYILKTDGNNVVLVVAEDIENIKDIL